MAWTMEVHLALALEMVVAEATTEVVAVEVLWLAAR